VDVDVEVEDFLPKTSNHFEDDAVKLIRPSGGIRHRTDLVEKGAVPGVQSRANPGMLNCLDQRYVVRHVSSEVFDPDPDSEDLHTSNGGQDIFLCKFNALGEFVWARTWGGSAYDRGYSLAVDPDGNVFVTGVFKGANVDFDPGPGVEFHTSNGSDDVYVSMFQSGGIHVAAMTFGGPDFDSGFGLAAHSSGTSYVTGSFQGVVDFDPGGGVDIHTSAAHDDIFVIRFDPMGDFEWARTWGGSAWDIGYDVVVDEYENAFIAGMFQTTVDFAVTGAPCNELSDPRTVIGSKDNFLVKLLPNGCR